MLSLGILVENRSSSTKLTRWSPVKTNFLDSLTDAISLYHWWIFFFNHSNWDRFIRASFWCCFTLFGTSNCLFSRWCHRFWFEFSSYWAWLFKCRNNLFGRHFPTCQLVVLDRNTGLSINWSRFAAPERNLKAISYKWKKFR